MPHLANKWVVQIFQPPTASFNQNWVLLFVKKIQHWMPVNIGVWMFGSGLLVCKISCLLWLHKRSPFVWPQFFLFHAIWLPVQQWVSKTTIAPHEWSATCRQNDALEFCSALDGHEFGSETMLRIVSFSVGVTTANTEIRWKEQLPCSPRMNHQWVAPWTKRVSYSGSSFTAPWTAVAHATMGESIRITVWLVSLFLVSCSTNQGRINQKDISIVTSEFATL